MFYLYAVLGVYTFSENDPWHFSSLFLSLLTLFRCATLEDWTDVYYINFYGCDEYDSIYQYTNSSSTSTTNFYEMNPDFFCEDPTPRPLISTFFFVTFIVISAFVMLRLY